MADAPDTQGDLFDGQPLVPDGTVVVNGRCLLRTRDGHRVVVVAGITLLHYAVGDAASQAHAIVCLVAQGWATQIEVARAFGCSTRTVRRHQQRFEDGGLAALGRGAGYPSGRPRATPSRAGRIHRLKANGLSLRQIARALASPRRQSARRSGAWAGKRPQRRSLSCRSSRLPPGRLRVHISSLIRGPEVRTQTCPVLRRVRAWERPNR